MRKTDKISVVIPAYYVNPDFVVMTKKCLDSMGNIGQKILVNDGSPISHSMDTIHYPKNQGYAHAVNEGLKQTTGDIIIICNNDIEFVQPDWLKHLLKPLNEGYDISSIRTTDSDGWFPDDYISEGDKFGSIWAMKRKVYETLGGLSENYGKGYFEDLDYHRRAEEAGFKIGKNHAGLVHHEGKATFKVTDPDDTSYHESMGKFIQKWGRDKL